MSHLDNGDEGNQFRLLIDHRRAAIACLVSKGRADKEIALLTSLSGSTVGATIHAMLTEGDLHNRAELAAWYLRFLSKLGVDVSDSHACLLGDCCPAYNNC